MEVVGERLELGRGEGSRKKAKEATQYSFFWIDVFITFCDRGSQGRCSIKEQAATEESKERRVV